MKYEMPALTDEQREDLTEKLQEELESLEQRLDDVSFSEITRKHLEDRLITNKIALAALTAGRVYFAEDLREPEKLVRIDSARYESIVDGCRGKQAYYTAPPVPALKLPDEMTHSHHDEYAKATCLIWNNCLAEVKRLNGVTK